LVPLHFGRIILPRSWGIERVCCRKPRDGRWLASVRRLPDPASGRVDLLGSADVNVANRPMVPQITAPDGCHLTLADLPLPGTKRWVVRRKAAVVAAVRGGLLSLDEACRRYSLNLEEFQSWQRHIDCFGLAGLRTTRIQFYHGNLGRAQRALAGYHLTAADGPGSNKAPSSD
jgi:hypothetical protein